MITLAFKPKPQDIHVENLNILKQKLKSKDLDGCYIFYGDEDYTKNHYSRLLTSEANGLLNVTTFYGGEFTSNDIINACSTSAVETFDLFSLDEDETDNEENDGVRVIKLIDPDFSVLSKADSEQLCSFLSDLPKNAIVIILLHDKTDEELSKGLLKKLSEFSLIVNFRREPSSSSILITWILRHFSKEKLNVDRNVAVHLCQTVGNSMSDLKNEIDKLIDYLHYENRDTLTCDDIDFICIKCTDAQIFEISSNALSGNFTKAAKALGVLRDKREAPLLILGTISKAVNDLCITEHYIKQGIAIPAIAKITKIPEFIVKNNSTVITNRGRDFSSGDSFAKTISLLCMEYDKKLKSSRTDDYELILELIFKLSFAGRTTTTT